jgi:hypothetical protein
VNDHDLGRRVLAEQRLHRRQDGLSGTVRQDNDSQRRDGIR